MMIKNLIVQIFKRATSPSSLTTFLTALLLVGVEFVIKIIADATFCERAINV